jgi:FMN phosphatase YigB (HAD superfamily)
MRGAVALDCYGTLVDESRIFRDAFDGVTSPAFARRFDCARAAVVKHEVFLSQRERYELALHAAAAESGEPVDIVLLRDRIMQNFADAPAVAGAAVAIATLRGMNFRVGLAANGDRAPVRDLIRRNGFELDFVVTSEGARAYKPSREFFAHVLAAAQTSALRTTMVGNDLDDDIQGAVAAGLRAIWVSSVAGPVPPDVALVRSLSEACDVLEARGS